MNPLTQQLEDKKKERLEIRCKDCGIDTPCDKCNNLLIDIDNEIAILEQAIAEMQKQRQEILDNLNKELMKLVEEIWDLQKDCANLETCDKDDAVYLIERLQTRLLNQQLDQPKTK